MCAQLEHHLRFLYSENRDQLSAAAPSTFQASRYSKFKFLFPPQQETILPLLQCKCRYYNANEFWIRKCMVSPKNFCMDKLKAWIIQKNIVFMGKHVRNHVDPDCHKNNNPRNCPKLIGVNTSVCEHIFSWLNEYKQSKEMNQGRWMWFFTLFGLA